MHYLVICRDVANGPAIRAANRPKHLAHHDAIAKDKRVMIAGPITPGPLDQATASVFILEAKSPEDARAYVELDPYYQAGLWREISIEPFLAARGAWVGK